MWAFTIATSPDGRLTDEGIDHSFKGTSTVPCGELEKELARANGHMARLKDELISRGLTDLLWGTQQEIDTSVPDEVRTPLRPFLPRKPTSRSGSLSPNLRSESSLMLTLSQRPLRGETTPGVDCAHSPRMPRTGPTAGQGWLLGVVRLGPFARLASHQQEALDE